MPRQHALATILDINDELAWKDERKTATSLEELKSPSGMPYIDTTGGSGQEYVFLSGKPRYAETRHEEYPYPLNSHDERAYYCPNESLWIQGTPYAEEFNDISILSGSAGLILKCRLCNSEIGCIVELKS